MRFHVHPMGMSPPANSAANPMASTSPARASAAVPTASEPAPVPHRGGQSASTARAPSATNVTPAPKAEAHQPGPIVKKIVHGSKEFKGLMSRIAARKAKASNPTNGSSTVPQGSTAVPGAVRPYESNYVPSGLGDWESLPISACFDGINPQAHMQRHSQPKSTVKVTDPSRSETASERVDKDPRTLHPLFMAGARSSKRPSAQEVLQNGLSEWNPGKWKDGRQRGTTPKQDQGNQQAQEKTIAPETAVPKMTVDEIVEKLAPRRPAAVPTEAQRPKNRTQPQRAEQHRREPQAFVDIYGPGPESYRRPAGDCYRPSYALSTASSRAREVRAPAIAKADSMLPGSVSHRSDRASQEHQVVQPPRSRWVSSPANTKSSHIREERPAKRASPPLSTGSATSSPHASTEATTAQAQATGGNALENELAMLPPALQAKVANPFLETSSSGRKRGREMDEVEENEAGCKASSNQPGPSQKRAKIASNRNGVPKKAAITKKAVAKKDVATQKTRGEKPARKRARSNEDEHEGEEDMKSRKRQKGTQSEGCGESSGVFDMDDFVVHDTPKVRRRRKNSGGAARKFVKG